MATISYNFNMKIPVSSSCPNRLNSETSEKTTEKPETCTPNEMNLIFEPELKNLVDPSYSEFNTAIPDSRVKSPYIFTTAPTIDKDDEDLKFPEDSISKTDTSRFGESASSQVT